MCRLPARAAQITTAATRLMAPASLLVTPIAQPMASGPWPRAPTVQLTSSSKIAKKNNYARYVIMNDHLRIEATSSTEEGIAANGKCSVCKPGRTEASATLLKDRKVELLDCSIKAGVGLAKTIERYKQIIIAATGVLAAAALALAVHDADEKATESMVVPIASPIRPRPVSPTNCKLADDTRHTLAAEALEEGDQCVALQISRNGKHAVNWNGHGNDWKIVLSVKFDSGLQTKGEISDTMRLLLPPIHFASVDGEIGGTYISGSIAHAVLPDAYYPNMLTNEWDPGHSDTCKGHNCTFKGLDEAGRPTNATCWGGSFYWHVVGCHSNGGMMLQICEIGVEVPVGMNLPYFVNTFRYPHFQDLDWDPQELAVPPVGPGQRQECGMAAHVGIKFVRVFFLVPFVREFAPEISVNLDVSLEHFVYQLKAAGVLPMDYIMDDYTYAKCARIYHESLPPRHRTPYEKVAEFGTRGDPATEWLGWQELASLGGEIRCTLGCSSIKKRNEISIGYSEDQPLEA